MTNSLKESVAEESRKWRVLLRIERYDETGNKLVLCIPSYNPEGLYEFDADIFPDFILSKKNIKHYRFHAMANIDCKDPADLELSNFEPGADMDAEDKLGLIQKALDDYDNIRLGTHNWNAEELSEVIRRILTGEADA